MTDTRHVVGESRVIFLRDPVRQKGNFFGTEEKNFFWASERNPNEGSSPLPAQTSQTSQTTAQTPRRW